MVAASGSIASTNITDRIKSMNHFMKFLIIPKENNLFNLLFCLRIPTTPSTPILVTTSNNSFVRANRTHPTYYIRRKKIFSPHFYPQ